MDNVNLLSADFIKEDTAKIEQKYFASSYPTYPTGTKISDVLSKKQIEVIVRTAYKNYRRKGERFNRRRASEYDKVNRIEVLNRFLLSNPPIFHLKNIREYLNGERKNKRILTIILNLFDEPQHIFFDDNFYFLMHGLLMDKVLLITYLDDLREKKLDNFKSLQWSLKELQIIKLHEQLVENNIIDNQVSVGEFYQIFDNYVALFNNPIRINAMNLACLLFWCREKNCLSTLQPYKIIEQKKMFCSLKGKLINAHNLNRYISEYKDDFKDSTKPIFSKIREIIVNL